MKKTLLQTFLKYSSLNVLGMLCISCYILADTFFIAKGFGANGLAALNLAIPFYSIMYGCGLLFGMGGGTKYAIFKSQLNERAANQVFTNTIALALGCALFFAIIGLLFAKDVAQLLGADETIKQMTADYLQVLLLFAPVLMLNTVLLCFIRNDGAPQLSMFGMMTGSFSNILFDYVFIFMLGLGFFGAALATGVAQMMSLCVLSIYFIRKRNSFHLIRCKISASLGKKIVAIGVPSLLTEVSSGIVIIVFNLIILDLAGNTGVAAYGIIANISLVTIAIYTGIEQGTQPLVSRQYGIGNHQNVKKLLRYAFTKMAIISAVIYVFVFFGASSIIGIFNNEQNEMLQQIAIKGLRIYFTGCIFAGFNIVLAIYFASITRTLPAQIIAFLRGFVLMVPMAFLLSSMGGMTGVWLVFPVTELVVAMIGSWLLFRKMPSHKKIE